MHNATTYFAGVDWAKRKHYVHLVQADGTEVAHGRFPHTGAGLRDMADWLRQHTADGTVHVTIEVPHGPVVEALQHHGFAVHSINPKQLHHARAQRNMSGAKDDPRDARVMTEVARTAPDSVRAQPPESPHVTALRLAQQQRDRLVEQRTALVHQLAALLWQYFPALLALGGSRHSPWFLDLCTAVPTPAAAHALTPEALDAQLPTRRGRRRSAAELLEQLRAEPLPVATDVAAMASANMLEIVAQLRLLNQQIAAAETRRTVHLTALQQAAEAQAAHADAATVLATAPADAIAHLQPGDLARLRTLPGVGDNVLAQLIAYGYDCVAQRNRPALRCFAGLAPVTVQSGKQRGVRMRRAVNMPMRNAMHHMAGTAVLHNHACRNYYDSMRDRGIRHGHALRAVADRLLRIAFAMLRDGTEFDPHRPTRWDDVTHETNEENGANEN